MFPLMRQLELRGGRRTPSRPERTRSARVASVRSPPARLTVRISTRQCLTTSGLRTGHDKSAMRLHLLRFEARSLVDLDVASTIGDLGRPRTQGLVISRPSIAETGSRTAG